MLSGLLKVACGLLDPKQNIRVKGKTVAQKLNSHNSNDLLMTLQSAYANMTESLPKTVNHTYQDVNL